MSSASYTRSSFAQTEPIKINNDDDFTAAPKIEYKEYTFHTNPNKEVEKKVSEFWKTLGNHAPPKSNFNYADISKCMDQSTGFEEENLDESDRDTIFNSGKYKWTNTFCLFKAKDLEKTAAAAKPKECKICKNDKFDPIFADENNMHEFMKVELEELDENEQKFKIL